MFLAGGFSRLGLDAVANHNAAKATQYGAASAAMVFIFTFVFGATWLTVPWLYPAEIFPLAVRAKGNAWGVVGWSIGNGWLVCVTHPVENPLRRLICAAPDPVVSNHVQQDW
jgi:Sugar (and other) transporter